MKALGVLLLALAMSGCVPIVYSARYDKPSRQNLTDEVPAFIEQGRSTMADVLLALGDPDTVAADESWVAYTSTYREGGGGAALVLVGGGQAGLLGAARRQMLYRRLLLRFDAAGVVTAATLDLVHCGTTDYFFGTAAGSEPPCVDVTGIELLARDVADRLQEAGETNTVIYPQVEWVTTHERGMLAVTDTAVRFVPSIDGKLGGSAVVRLDLAGLSGARLAGNPFFFTGDSRRRVVLLRGEDEFGAFVVLTGYIEDSQRTADASKLMQERIEAARARTEP
jgi:hypothetical protein